MKHIEDFWDDVLIYSVGFLTNDDVERKIIKTLIFPIDYTEQDILDSVMEKFRNVKAVTIIEEYTDGLMLKK